MTAQIQNDPSDPAVLFLSVGLGLVTTTAV